MSKVRFFLEKSIPELEDLQKKGVFTKSEITMLMRKRTDFEQRITGRGARPRDFLKYVEWEKNVERLRLKRLERLHIEHGGPLEHASMRRRLFVLERAVNKFPAENDLWLTYLDVARENGAIKVIYEVYSKLLQLQPTNIDAWLSAAKFEFEENSNALGARLLFQRGLRLNSESTRLWLAYCQFELTYVAKLLARRKLLGLTSEQAQAADMEQERKEKTTEEELQADEIALPDDDEKTLTQLPEADLNMLGNPDTNPALKGDVALAIFDAAMTTLPKHTRETPFSTANKFLAIFDKFDQRNYLYSHVLDELNREHSDDVRTHLLDITLPIRTVTVDSPDFADQLQLSVNKFLAYKARKPNPELTKQFCQQLEAKFITEENTKVNEIVRKIITKVKA